jgi:proteasomal ATPase-associated factor 1
LEGHKGDITVCKIFPSSEVAISSGYFLNNYSGLDTQIKIWRLKDGLCAVTLKGHNGGVFSLSIIEKGRNFVTSSR